jgi:hypothetical protein
MTNSTKFNYLGYLILFVFLAIGLYLRIVALQGVTLSEQEWITRDFDRAINIVEGSYIPLAGPESNNGGRLPGPFMYFWLAIPLLFHKSYQSIFVFNFLLNFASIVGLFFILKKHFSLYFAILSSALLSISVHHISAINFPINPAFIFPFVVLYLFFIFDFALKNMESRLPWLVMIICLGIQLHYSMITLLLIPVVLAFGFKIKISLKTIMKSIAIALICFIPYGMFKAQTFEPTNDGTKKTLGNYKSFSAISVVKMIAVQNTITRIVKSTPFDSVESSYFIWIRTGILTLVIYILFIKLLINVRNNSVSSNKKETVLLTLFLIPAWEYEIIQPFLNHYWYTYIFILPTVLILSQAAIILFKALPQGKLQILLPIALVVIMGGHTSIAYEETHNKVQELEKGLTFGTYKNSKLFLERLMSDFNLSPEEVMKRVYFLEFRPSSLNRLKFAYKEVKSSQKIPSQNNEKTCFFLLGGNKHEERGGQLAMAMRIQRRNILLKDPTIKITSQKFLNIPISGSPKVFFAIEYQPKMNQSCYANAFNPFVSTKPIIDLLRQAKNMGKKELKTLSFEDKYDSEGNLSYLKGQFIIRNTSTQTPFRLTLNIDKKESQYFLKGKIEAYYFWGPSNIQMTNLDIQILSLHDAPSSLPGASSISNRLGRGVNHTIITNNTLASSMNYQSGWADWSYNQEWYREVPISKEISLKKGQFYIDLLFKMDTQIQLNDQIRQIFYPTYVNLTNPKSKTIK